MVFVYEFALFKLIKEIDEGMGKLHALIMNQIKEGEQQSNSNDETKKKKKKK